MQRFVIISGELFVLNCFTQGFLNHVIFIENP